MVTKSVKLRPLDKLRGDMDARYDKGEVSPERAGQAKSSMRKGKGRPDGTLREDAREGHGR